MSTHEADNRLGGAGKDAADGQGLSDAELLAQVGQGDQEAFATLWSRHSVAGWHEAKRAGAASPDDIVSEAYTRILDLIERGKGPTGEFRPYLFVTVRNLVHKLAAKKSEQVMETLPEVVDAEPGADESALRQLDALRVRQVLSEMNPRYRDVLVTVEMQGHSVGEAAVAAGVSSHNMTMLLARAKQSFRQKWEQAHVKTVGKTPECNWVLERAGAYQTGELSAKNRDRLETHLAECPDCTAALKEGKSGARMWGRALGGGAGLGGGLAGTTPAFAATPGGLAAIVTGGVLTLATLAWWIWPTGPDPALAPSPVATSPAVTPTPSPTVTPSVEPSPSEPPAAAEPSPATTTPASRPESPAPTTPAAPAAQSRPPITVLTTGDGAGICYPALAGTAEPGAQLAIGGTTQGPVIVQAGPDGAWQSPVLSDFRAGTRRLTLTYSDGPNGGSVSVSVSVATPPSLGVSARPTSTTVILHGQAGAAVAILLDGAPWANGELDATGRLQLELPAVPPGEHTISSRYAADCQAPATTITVTQG